MVKGNAKHETRNQGAKRRRSWRRGGGDEGGDAGGVWVGDYGADAGAGAAGGGCQKSIQVLIGNKRSATVTYSGSRHDSWVRKYHCS
jgi:hypothetical protein